MLRLSQGGEPSTTIRLTKEQGTDLKALLEKSIDCRFTSYCHQIGLEYSNIIAMLNGRKKISYKTLERLFSKTELEVECRTEFIIQRNLTSIVPDVDCPNLEEELFLEGKEE